MRVFLTGASGHVAAAVIPELVAAGHDVVGLARSDESAAVVLARGAEVLRGDLDDVDVLADAARGSDGVIHLAFNHDFGAYDEAIAVDLRAVQEMGAALEASDKPFVITSGTLMLAFAGGGGVGTEQDTLSSGPRVDAENLAIELGGRGVRSSVVRLSPLVHGPLDAHGFAHRLVEVARTTGTSGYVGDGQQRWPAVSTLDAARLYRLALESAPAGTRLHAVHDEGVPIRTMAETIGRRLGLPTASVEPEDALEVFGFLGLPLQLDNPTSSAITQSVLAWTPTEPGIFADLETDHYTPTG